MSNHNDKLALLLHLQMLCIYTESIIDCSKEKLRMYDIVRLLSNFRFINLIDNPSERFDNVNKDDKSFDHQSYAEFSYLFIGRALK